MGGNAERCSGAHVPIQLFILFIIYSLQFTGVSAAPGEGPSLTDDLSLFRNTCDVLFRGFINVVEEQKTSSSDSFSKTISFQFVQTEVTLNDKKIKSLLLLYLLDFLFIFYKSLFLLRFDAFNQSHVGDHCI